jgi:hypothetical protein
MKRKLPLPFSVAIKRLGSCLKCDFKDSFKNWERLFFAFRCPKCGYELNASGAVRGWEFF